MSWCCAMAGPDHKNLCNYVVFIVTHLTSEVQLAFECVSHANALGGQRGRVLSAALAEKYGATLSTVAPTHSLNVIHDTCVAIERRFQACTLFPVTGNWRTWNACDLTCLLRAVSKALPPYPHLQTGELAGFQPCSHHSKYSHRPIQNNHTV